MKKTKFNHSKAALSLLAVSSVLLLQACGGGGGDGSGQGSNAVPSNVQPTTAPDPSPKPPTPLTNNAKFVASESTEYLLIGPSVRDEPLDGFVQAADGAMTTLETRSLGGAYEVKQLSGDADFAMGRWVKGTVTETDTQSGRPEITTLTGQDAGSYHYLVFNAATNLPQAGNYVCDAGTFTTPTYDSGGANARSAIGTVTGSASLRFEARGPRVAGEIVVNADGASGSVSLEQMEMPGQKNFTTHTNTGSYFNNTANNSSGAAISVARASGGGFYLMTGYAAVLSNGARYIGVSKFNCK